MHTSSMRAHAKSMRTHSHPNPNPENKNTTDRNSKSNNLACLKTEKLRNLN